MARAKQLSTFDKVMKYGLDSEVIQAIQAYVVSGKPPSTADRTLMEFYLRSRSTVEDEWRQYDAVLISGATGRTVSARLYEWLTFKLPGGSYTPDFVYVMDNGMIVCVEVKGSKRQTNYRDARAKLRAAASLNPWFLFYEALKERNWSLEHIKPDPDFIKSLILL